MKQIIKNRIYCLLRTELDKRKYIRNDIVVMSAQLFRNLLLNRSFCWDMKKEFKMHTRGEVKT